MPPIRIFELLKEDVEKIEGELECDMEEMLLSNSEEMEIKSDG
jgi:hypothetical protein